MGAINPRHFAPKAKRVIYLYMAGGPSHLETLDYKPKLAEMSGKPMPESFTKGQPIAQLQGQALKCLAPAPEVDEVCALAVRTLGQTWPWIRPLACRYVETFEARARPRHRDVVAFLSDDKGFSGARAKYGAHCDQPRLRPGLS